MNKIILKEADNRRTNSFAVKLRRKRFGLFIKLLESIKKEDIKILDVGGTVLFWENMNFIEICKKKKIEITILNLMQQASRYEFIKPIIGDARDLSRFKDKQFDIVFSNSVIEHITEYEGQKIMADEIRRVGQNYFIQTPNIYFPIEPHFLFPFFQFLPFTVKVSLLRCFDLGWYKKANSRQDAKAMAREIQLLNIKEFKAFFPEGEIYKEKLFGLTKSFIAYKFV